MQRNSMGPYEIRFLDGRVSEFADLRSADLSRSNLWCADLRGANLWCADLSRANLSGANLPDFQLCPEIGAFRAFKKARSSRIVELGIPADAHRTSSLVGRKCRASKAKVLSIKDLHGNDCSEAVSRHDYNTVYRVGEYVTPDFYDGDIRVECTNGIHFFITRKEAEQYQ